ncbi:MAG: hypothetical protein COV75_00295 [Candidatus Omnitrophica bacterium CG11_big_fil_rev_8_21_14_0_20_63_9]|nr:MAG: hypothetical protein COV75_00295 [Candidatus Omnitrophica bacterium CG11_big_fil_rev_8_21_14_0_20_63_9]
MSQADVLRRFAAVLGAHWVLAQLMPSPWWVPNLTIGALVLWTGRWPSRWWLFAVCAGWWMMVATVREPGAALIGCVLIASATRVAVRQFDWDDPYLPEICVVLGTAALTLSTLWTEHVASPTVLALALLHVCLTTLTVPLLRRVAG